ncbi:response regulator [Actinomadura rubrisoli]|uniref:Response regulator transcription factor n=1 Tax=Actinomadura rubrisoli TaxID=2530368 RepID=A0A4R5BQP6_9ACTN|nr:response regulator transcription factor [Actinomadura rubrisoli]TDD86392.1 response regulator transcription factor [Actinomadura rubrisoli]
MTIRTLLADDEAMVRAGVRAILAASPEIEVVGEAADGREAIDLAQRLRPQMALLDIRMPVLDGLAATTEILRTVPRTSVLVLTTFGDDLHIARALGEGASGFLLKAGDPRELITGIHAVASGGAYLSPSVARRVITRLGGPDRMSRVASAHIRVAALTDRERDVLALLGVGMSNVEIARRLCVVEATVKTHVSAILSRLGVHNRVQAALVAYQAGLVDTNP